ncbi:hypothetical protein KJ854_04610, partial [Patescibacteria group bacterium]|nr:hypothetical protein [Patescibacteria group bacterium]
MRLWKITQIFVASFFISPIIFILSIKQAGAGFIDNRWLAIGKRGFLVDEKWRKKLAKRIVEKTLFFY